MTRPWPKSGNTARQARSSIGAKRRTSKDTGFSRNMEREMNVATSGEKPARYKIEKAKSRFKRRESYLLLHQSRRQKQQSPGAGRAGALSVRRKLDIRASAEGQSASGSATAGCPARRDCSSPSI